MGVRVSFWEKADKGAKLLPGVLVLKSATVQCGGKNSTISRTPRFPMPVHFPKASSSIHTFLQIAPHPSN